jgi:Xaa-Pro aminopeptidase
MIEPSRGFAVSEFESRLAKAQTQMQDQGLSAMLLNTEPEVRYFSGFLSQFWQSPTRPWFMVIPVSGKPIAVIPEIGRACMSNTWIKDIRTWDAPNPDDDGVSLLADTLSEVAGASGVIGVMKGAESHLRMPLADYEKLVTLLVGNPIRDCNELVRGLRVVKSEAEIDKIRHAAQAASRAFLRVPEFVSIGMSDRETFQAMKHELLNQGVDDVSYLVGGSGSGGYGDIISPPSQRKLQSGDVVILDTGCIWDGDFCDFDRNYSIGKPSEEVADAHRIIWDATEAGLELCKSGTTCAQLFQSMNKAMGLGDDAGSVGRLGHGLGMQLTEHPSHAAFDQTVLQEGMVLTLEPGYEFAPGKMMVHEENIVVRADGAELLSTRVSREIVVI